jgi:hypothetical protein
MKKITFIQRTEISKFPGEDSTADTGGTGMGNDTGGGGSGSSGGGDRA